MRSLLLLLLLPLLALAAPVKDPPLFDPDPDHVANRLYPLLYEANLLAGVDEQESLEPSGRLESRFLAKGESLERPLALLDAFFAASPARRLQDPRKRAILQRDLWSTFADTTGPPQPLILEQTDGRMLSTQRWVDPGDMRLDRRRERRELQQRLVRAMRAVALSEAEIQGLPDNFAEAVKAGSFPRDFDPKHPEQAFLPPNLFAADGPWLAVQSPTQTEGLAAPAHLAHTKGRGLFLVFVRLPGGRRATEAFVRQLRDGRPPPLPTGTQTALLRRTLLIDDQGRLRVTPLTESLQVRVFQGDHDTGLPYAFRLRRADLAAGRPAALQAISLKDRNCVSCHARANGNGVRSITSQYAGDRTRPGLDVTDLKAQARNTLAWIEKTYSWGLLQGLWESPAAR